MSFLPPGLQSISSHTFGSLFIQITSIKTNKNIDLTHFSPQFFGQSPDENINSSNASQAHCQQVGTIMQYKLLTNLWLFYLYLSDMETITVSLFQPNSNNNACFIKVPVDLRTAKEVMTPQFKEKNIFKSKQPSQHTIVDSRGNTYGFASVLLWTQFMPDIHEEIKQLVNFNQLVVFQGISPINSQTQLPREPPQQLSAITVHTSNMDTRQKFEQELEQSELPSLDHAQHNSSHDEEQQSRILEDDIDKMIREMQAKSYDPSRYQETSNDTHKQTTQTTQYERVGGNQLKSNTYSVMSGSNANSEDHKNSNRFQETQASLKHSMSRPPSYSPHRPKLKVEPPQQTIISSKSQHMLKQTQTSQPQSSAMPKPDQQNRHLDLKIHEMLVSISNALPHTLFEQLMQPCYTLKIYLNNDLEQYFAAQGIKQGEIVTFNQSLKIRNIAHLTSIRFTISDDYGKVECEGRFDLTRLFASKEMKGVFTVPLLAYGGNLASKIKVAENKLLEVSPLHRTLRIEAELVQKIEMVQIFMKVSKISQACSLIRYKIPMTKQTIQHMGHNHVNIFPHTCSPHVPDKIILQFWKNEQNIGQSQISLKNIKNTNISTLNSSIDPVYLYDGKKQIRNILEGDRIVGDFVLTLCFGTVMQMQSLLLNAINEEKQTQQQAATKVQASIDERLGVIINKKPILNEISVQVEMEQEPAHFTQLNQDNKFNAQPSFGDQSIISHTSHNEFMDGSLVSFAKHEEDLTYVQPVFTKQQKPKPTVSYPTVTQKVGEKIAQLLTPLIPIISKLKQLSKPHLVYNFINEEKLKEILLKLGIKAKIIQMIFKLALFAKADMVNVNILYDLAMNAQIEGTIKANSISDEMLIVGAMRLLYGNQKLRKNVLLESQMEFKEMADLYKKVQLKLTLHEYKTLEKFINKYKSRKDAQELKAAVVKELEGQTVVEVQECFYEQDILKQIYGDQSSSMNSFQYSQQFEESQYTDRYPPKQQIEELPRFSQGSLQKVGNQLSNIGRKQTKQQVKQVKQVRQAETKRQITPSKYQKERQKSKDKSNKKQMRSHRITIDGVENAIQSVQCVFDRVPEDLYIELVIESPISKIIKFGISQHESSFQSTQLNDVDGKVHLMSNNSSIACAAFSLIKGVKSLYALKTKDGEFCGLLHLMFE